uniref:Uncharacterized protein n=1 Tax=Plectus sambesii TaxID=2011161 RepID=A0A914UZB6_9BILA
MAGADGEELIGREWSAACPRTRALNPSRKTRGAPQPRRWLRTSSGADQLLCFTKSQMKSSCPPPVDADLIRVTANDCCAPALPPLS